jgi:hypothetical protein
MSIFKPENAKEYAEAVDRGIDGFHKLNSNLSSLSLLIWKDKETTGDPFRDWAIVNFGVNYEITYHRGLENCNAINECLTGKEGELILIHEDWEHSRRPGYKLYLGILSGEGLKVTRDEHFDSEDYNPHGIYTKWDPRGCEQPLLLEACLKPGSKLYTETYDVYRFPIEEPVKDNLEIKIAQKPLELNARMFKCMYDNSMYVTTNPDRPTPDFVSRIDLRLLQDKSYEIKDAHIIIGTERVLEYMKQISKNPKITSAETPEALVELLK